MDRNLRAQFDNLKSQDRDLQNKAYFHILKITEVPVNWAYEVWDEMLEGLSHEDNHVRSIAAQILSNLARSDPKNRILKDFKILLAVTKDERFVTARHCLQSLWKVGVAGKKQQKVYLEGMEHRFRECAKEKNCKLIRYDICQSLRNVYEQTGDEKVREKALKLIGIEKDDKYRKKYSTLWRQK
jgi:hypothetical protein